MEGRSRETGPFHYVTGGTFVPGHVSNVRECGVHGTEEEVDDSDNTNSWVVCRLRPVLIVLIANKPERV